MVYLADDIAKLLVKLAADDLTGILGTIAPIQTDLGSEHRSGHRGSNAMLGRRAGIGIEPGRNIDGHDSRLALVDAGIQMEKGAQDIAVEPCTQDSIDDDIGRVDKGYELIARGTDMDGNITPSGTAGDMPSERAGDLIGLERRDDINVHAPVAQDIRSNPPVATIVTKAGKHEHALWRLFFLTSSATNSPASSMSSALEVPSDSMISSRRRTSSVFKIGFMLSPSVEDGWSCRYRTKLGVLNALELVQNRFSLLERTRDQLFLGLACILFGFGASLLGDSHRIGNRDIGGKRE